MLEIEISMRYGSYATCQGIYIYPASLSKFGEQLEQFGSSTSEEVVLEAGSPDESYYSWLRLRAYIFDAVGHSALEISTQQNGAPHIRARCQFSAPLDVSLLNSLGKQIKAWAKASDQPLAFESQYG